jgi:hypothetical protein
MIKNNVVMENVAPRNVLTRILLVNLSADVHRFKQRIPNPHNDLFVCSVELSLLGVYLRELNAKGTICDTVNIVKGYVFED